MISAMLNDNPMIEGTSGQVEIPDFTSDVIESLFVDTSDYRETIILDL